MNPSNLRKNKVVLADYDYRREIDTRLLMANLTVKSVEVLKEILDGSLKITLSHLSDVLEMPKTALLPILAELEKVKLFHLQGDLIIVDKEMRKFLETQMMKFDPDYMMGIDFLHGTLSKIPINTLTNWYALSRTSDNLFTSIVEKYLQVPQLYQRHLEDLANDIPRLIKIGRDVMKQENFELTANEIMQKYNLSHVEFEESILELELNFVCCLGYRQLEDKWEEVVMPFQEWREHLTLLRESAPKAIETLQDIEKDHTDDFGFLKTIIDCIKTKKLGTPKQTERMLLLGLLDETAEGPEFTPLAEEWLHHPLPEQAATLYRHMLHKLNRKGTFVDRDLRQVQKDLNRVVKSGWIYFDDFIKGFTRAVGTAEPIQLKKKGKRWRYAPPVFSEAEQAFIFYAIFELLLEVGIVSTGKHLGRPCFAITPFGRISLEE